MLTNDTDVDTGDALTVTTTGAQVGTYGTVTIAANGTYSFTLNNGNAAVQALGVGQTLTQSFNYTISDGNGGTSTSTLTITITGTNDGPVANPDTADDRGRHGRAGHRQRADQRHRCRHGDALTVTTTGAQVGTYGTVTIAANGAYSFTLNNGNAAVQALGVGQTLTQSFNYTISDGNGGTSTSTLTITITGTNDGPVANADTATIAEDTVAPVTGNVLTNDTDVDRRRADGHHHGRPGRQLRHGHHRGQRRLQLCPEQRQPGGPGPGRRRDPDRDLQLHDLRRQWRHVDLDADHHHHRHQRRADHHGPGQPGRRRCDVVHLQHRRRLSRMWKAIP